MSKFSLLAARLALGVVIIGVFYGSYAVLCFEVARAAQAVSRAAEPTVELETPVVEQPRKLSRVQREACIANAVGCAMKNIGKAAPNGWLSKPVFVVMQHVGVQVQIRALADLEQLSHNPAIAGVQGFFVGL